jgi:hypothetical protein
VADVDRSAAAKKAWETRRGGRPSVQAATPPRRAAAMKAWETIRAKKLAAKSGVPAPAAAPAPAAPHAPAAVAASPAPAPASAPPAAPHTPAAAPHAPAAPATQPADSPARARALKAWETMRAKKAALAASPGAPGAAPKGPSTPATPAAPAAPKAPREKKVEYSPSKTHKTVQAAYHEAMATGASDVDAHEDAINIAKEMGADDAQAAFHADAARDRHNREASKAAHVARARGARPMTFTTVRTPRTRTRSRRSWGCRKTKLARCTARPSSGPSPRAIGCRRRGNASTPRAPRSSEASKRRRSTKSGRKRSSKNSRLPEPCTKTIRTSTERRNGMPRIGSISAPFTSRSNPIQRFRTQSRRA